MLLRSLGKLVAVIVVAGLAGLAIGTGLSKLFGRRRELHHSA